MSPSSTFPSLPFLPSTLPLIPLGHPHVLFPFLQVSIALPAGQIAVILQSVADNARRHRMGGSDGDAAGWGPGGVERMVGVVPVVDIERRIGRWATAARIKRITRSPESSTSFIMTLEGLARIRLPRSLPPVLSILPGVSLYSSTYSLPLPILHSPTAPDLWTLAAPLLPSQVGADMKPVPVGLMADILATILGFDWEVRVELLGIVDVDQRADRVKEGIEVLLQRKAAGGQSTGGTPIKQDTEENDKGRLGNADPVKRASTPPPASRALVRRIPVRPAAIRARAPPTPSSPAGPIPDDLQPLYSLLSARTSELTGSAYHTITRELARLSKIPPQSAEYGVGKTYLELLLALPWKRVSEDMDVDLKVARERLEEEHEGLEEVKRRVIEYLAVYRLKKQLFVEEQQKAQVAKVEAGQATGDNRIDNSTASELLELIPSEGRAATETPLPPTIEDGPPTGTYRDRGPILLLVGPPGVGKTSIARSLADCLGRKFYRLSLGGVRDEAEIRGHRRTYVGALPGLPVQALRKVGVSNPVILLDELDKISTSSFHGDPSAALLEVLDPAQNWGFHDHYLGGDVPVDLSQVMFVATANTLDTIPAPLLDRCEVIQCGGYVMEEKVRIASRFLVKKQLKENGMKERLVRLQEEELRKVIEDYTRESGVRSLEREIAKLIRSKAVDYLQSLAASSSSSSSASSSTNTASAVPYDPQISPADIQRILGLPKYESESRELLAKPGVVHGLSYQGSGMGGVLVLEAVTMPSGKGRLRSTGRLGEVIQESAELALTWVRASAGRLGVGVAERLKEVDVHLHLPSGAVKKDGPSAGLAMVVAFVSLLTGREVPPTTAMTGEITLRGAITPVGGIKEKVLGAHRAGIKRIIMSDRNRKDVQADVPDSMKGQIDFSFVKTIDEALEILWGSSIWVEEERTGGYPPTSARSEARL